MPGNKFGCLTIAMYFTVIFLCGGGAGIAFKNNLPLIGIPMIILELSSLECGSSCGLSESSHPNAAENFEMSEDITVDNDVKALRVNMRFS